MISKNCDQRINGGCLRIGRIISSFSWSATGRIAITVFELERALQLKKKKYIVCIYIFFFLSKTCL